MGSPESLDCLFENRNPFWESLRLGRWHLILGLTMLGVTNILDALNPWLLGQAINALQKGPSAQLWFWSGAFIGVLSALALTRYLWRLFFGQYHAQVAHWLRLKLIHKLLNAPWSFLQKTPVGDLTSRVINDVNQWRQAVGDGLLVFIDGIWLLGLILPAMYLTEPRWFWWCLSIFPVLPILIWFILRGFFFHSHQAQEKLGELSSQTSENLGALKIIKSFNLQRMRVERFHEANQACAQHYAQMAKYDSLWELATGLAVAIATVLLIYLAFQQALENQLNLGHFVAYQRYLNKLAWPVSAIGLGLIRFQMGFASWQRISAGLKQPRWVQWGRQTLDSIESLELNHFVGFEDHQKPPIPNFRWLIEKGQKWVVTGPIGVGKSCLLETLAGLHPQGNRVLLNGKPLWQWDYESVKNQIVLVPQEPVLYSLSLRENLNPKGLPVSDETMKKILQMVALWNEVQQWPHGLETAIGEKGVNLSGGQKQRLALARALLNQPQWLLLDDPLSAVDTVTQNQILASLSQYELTWIWVTQRSEPFHYATHVLVLGPAGVIYQGPKNQLTWDDVIRLLENAALQKGSQA